MTKQVSAGSDSSRQADADGCLRRVESILREELDLAKPDDLAFLELQVPRIARRIVDVWSLECGSPASL